MVVGKMVKNWSKYLDLRFDWSEAKKRYYLNLSKFKHKKAISLLDEYKDLPFSFRPIFIIGPPRSGSTLLYQVLIHRYYFCYLQNRMEKHRFSIPIYVAKALTRTKTTHQIFRANSGKKSC